MALPAGHLFGNFRIVRLLGEGGFGEVYLAENPLIERRAAVKVLHKALAQDSDLVRRFLNEARAASAIRHRNIIEVFDAGVTPEGAPYILMEFLEGVSLQKRLADKGRLALPQTLEIARQAGSALAAAHAVGIVHRDLKPENLFLVPEPGAPGGERVKILDFGIAKIRSGGGTGGTLRADRRDHGQPGLHVAGAMQGQRGRGSALGCLFLRDHHLRDADGKNPVCGDIPDGDADHASDGDARALAPTGTRCAGPCGGRCHARPVPGARGPLQQHFIFRGRAAGRWERRRLESVVALGRAGIG